MNHIGKHLRGIRKNWGKTLNELSTFCGVSIDYLSKIEKGNRVPTDQLLKDLSDFYSIPYRELKELRVSDEILKLLDEVDNKKRVLKDVQKRLSNPDQQIHITNSKPLKKEKGKREYVKGGKNGKVKGFNYYILHTGKLIKREREELLKKSEEYMSITVGTELDPSLSDIELVEEWNQFFDQYGMRFPEFEESWFKENPLPEEMKNESDDDGSVKIELPEIFKKRDSLRSNLG